MVIEEYKSDSTIIRFYDTNLGTEDKNKEIVDILVTLILKKLQNIS